MFPKFITFGPTMLKYFKSREFLFTVLAVIGLGVLSYVLFFFVFLPFYTQHGEEAQVPKVAGLKLDEAITILEEQGLRYEVADSIYLSTFPPLAIISQDPLAESMVKPGRKVYLTVNKVVAPMVKLPDIIGVSQYQAKLRLEGANLIMGNLKYVPHQYRNLVLGAASKGQRINVGDTIRKGSIIDLVVGEGQGSQKVEIPDLVGETYESAIATLHRLGLNVGNRRFEELSPKAPGTILQQYPKYNGDSIHLGSAMDMWIAGPQPEENLEGESWDTEEGGDAPKENE